jgi:PleD family two-component response regulator
VLIQQADLALYEAKGKGRDQICIFNNTRSLHEQT